MCGGSSDGNGGRARLGGGLGRRRGSRGEASGEIQQEVDAHRTYIVTEETLSKDSYGDSNPQYYLRALARRTDRVGLV